MDFKEVIKNRHSVREFSDKKISKKILKEIIKDASLAPSASNEQPWYFYIINSNDKLNLTKEIVRKYYLNVKEEYNKKLSKKIVKLCNNFIIILEIVKP